MKLLHLTFFCFLMIGFLPLRSALIITYHFNGDGGNDPAEGSVAAAFSGKVTADDYNPTAGGLSVGDTGFSSANGNVYVRSTVTTNNSLPSSGTSAWHTFGLSVSGLAANEVLNLTDVTFGYQATGSTGGTGFFWSFFSDAVGSTYDLSERLANGDQGAPIVETVDLTSSNPVAGNLFTGLTNGTDIEFRVSFGDDGAQENNANSIHRLGIYNSVGQKLQINGEIEISAIPEPAAISLFLTAALALGLMLRRPR